MTQLDDAMAAWVDRGEYPGLVYLVAREDEVQVNELGSLARDNLFRITSMTKPVLAAATMMLVEDGTIALDEPIERLLPELAGQRVLARIDGPLEETVPAHRAVTVEDLLTFRMGSGLLTEPTFMPPFPIVEAGEQLRLTLGPPDPRSPHAPDEWIKLFGSLPLMYQPGERWLYNTPALVLGVLVARAAGVTLPRLLRTRVFEPLGMVDTGFHTTPENRHRIPGYYLTDQATGKVTRQTVSEPEQWMALPAFPSGADGLLSTVDDYLKFARMLLAGGGDLLSPASVSRMTTNHLTPAQIETGGFLLDPEGWGYGMAVSPEGWYGWDGGYGTVWFNDPHRKVIGMAFSQCSDFLFNGSKAEFIRLARA
jgi:CubicO group peptidase (beta-lactamase class C family)